MAQVHRFGDTVAAYLGDGETVYMTPKDARKLAKALTDCAKDIKAQSFVCGTFKTVAIVLEDTGHNGTKFEIERGDK